jgi:hypothetical protein
MIRLKLILVLVFLGVLLEAQTPVKFRKVIGNSGYDYGYSASQASDKGYIIGGSTSSFGSGNTDMLFIKTDSLGIPFKNKTFGGINIDVAKCIRQTNDKGYILLGYTNSYGNGGYDFYLVKMDSLYNKEWEKTYGGSDWDFGNCIEQTADGGYILCGSTYSFGSGNEDYYLVKINSSGDTEWTKTYGGVNEDVAKSVIQTTDGGYVLTGYTKSFGDTLGDFYTVKTNALGDTIWTNKFGGMQADFGNDIVKSISGGYIITGETSSMGSASSNGIVVRISDFGITVNYYAFCPVGSTGTNGFNSITEDNYGRVALVGRNRASANFDDVWFFVLNSDWTFYNASTFGTIKNETGFSVEKTADKCWIICGQTTGFNNGLDDIYLIKTDTMGLSGFTGSENNISVVGVQESIVSAENGFMLFPNPANNNFNVNVFNSWGRQKNEIVITDIFGKEIQRIHSVSTTTSIDVSSLENGIYFVSIKNENKISTQKLLIHH